MKLQVGITRMLRNLSIIEGRGLHRIKRCPVDAEAGTAAQLQVLVDIANVRLENLEPKVLVGVHDVLEGILIWQFGDVDLVWQISLAVLTWV
jgi:hypothetical protein